MLPRWTGKLLVILGTLGMIPFALIARARVSTSESPRIHLIHDMDHQPKFKAQARNELFADQRAMRPPVPGTVARGELFLDDHLYRGLTGRDEWAAGLPDEVPLSMETLRRGRQRYDIHCAVCHGYTGRGNGMVHQRAEQLATLGRLGMEWVQPTDIVGTNDLLDPAHVQQLAAAGRLDAGEQGRFEKGQLVGREDGYLFHVITNGIRNMPPYGPQVSVEDRWAIVAYLRALQRSQRPLPGDASGRTAPTPAPKAPDATAQPEEQEPSDQEEDR